MAVSAVLRTGQRFGRGRIVNHLRGEAKDQMDKDLSNLSTYGVGEALGPAGWRAVIDQLLFDGLLGEDDRDNRPVLYAPEKDTTRSLFQGDITVSLREDPSKVRKRERAKTASADLAAELSENDRALFEALREWRRESAREPAGATADAQCACQVGHDGPWKWTCDVGGWAPHVLLGST